MTRGKRTTVWLVIVLYATVVCAREGLHLLPGCGHTAHLSGGHLSVEALASKGQIDHAIGVSHSTDDNDGCPICKFCVLPVYDCSPAVLITASFNSSSAIWFSEPKVSRSVGSSFLSRGPPTV
jgi:hypothetical protein